MKRLLKLTLPAVLVSCAFSSYAVVGTDLSVGSVTQNNNDNNNSQDLDQITAMITNLGLYLGYDLTKKPSGTPSDELIDYSDTAVNEMYNYISALGAIPADVIFTQKGDTNSPYQDYFYFVPSNSPLASTLNPQWNYVFRKPAYSATGDADNGSVVASTLVDQGGMNGTYMLDPVSQGIFNMLTTPNDSFCQDWSSGEYVPKITNNCKFLTQSMVMANTVGSVPGGKAFAYEYNRAIVSQLNSNNLLAPLLYSTEPDSRLNSQDYGGLQANSQAQLASNYVRYATGLVTPPLQIDVKTFANLYNQANFYGKNKSVDYNTQMTSRYTLATYFSRMRSFIARNAAGLSNIYWIMSRRMPQDLSGDASNNQQTSQALEDFKMATWRLYKLNSDGSNSGQKNTQWLDKINSGSAATVQKESAVLLAEILYKLEQNNQLQERILLVNSLNMMLGNVGTMPNPPSSGGGDSTPPAQQ